MNVRSINEFRTHINNCDIKSEQAGLDFESTIRLRDDVESYFDLRRQMTSEDAEFAQKNLAGRMTTMDLNINPNAVKDAARASGLGEGEVFTRMNRQHYVELLYDVNEIELLTYIDKGAIHVAEQLGWSESYMMDEFNRYDREQAMTVITPEIKADSSFMRNMIMTREGFDPSTKTEDLPYYMQKELEGYEDYDYEEPDSNTYEPEPTNLFESKQNDADDVYKVKSDFRNRMYNTAFDDFGFDEKFDDEDDFDF